MTFIFGAILFILIWWIVLFTILPFKIKSQIESGQIVESTDPGVPENPRIVRHDPDYYSNISEKCPQDDPKMTTNSP